MKLCPSCDQPVAEEITTCPACGSEIGKGREFIDDYRIIDVLHEGYASLLCRAVRQRTNETVMIRLFTRKSPVDDEVASRLMREIEKLKQLPGEGFVRHHAIRRSDDGLWYRISEWIEGESWGTLLASGQLQDRGVLFDLFHQMAETLSVLHREGYFIPHLILNDIIVFRTDAGKLRVKIDYKLSRFFDPRLDRPGPMLQRLLDCHPDIIHRRPLDFRSDIWSLGKIFVELLTADLDCRNHLARIDDLHLPSEAAVLLKVMLAEDPDLRPRSMEEVASSLARIRKTISAEAPTPAAAPPPALPRALRRLQKRIRFLAAVMALMLIAGLAAWLHFGRGPGNKEAALEGYANQYAPSVAFLLVEYWLNADDKRYYRNMAEGTAFLVDTAGHMLTNRHVACPWLEDSTFMAMAAQIQQSGQTPHLGFRMFLWFEGQKAFNRSARLMENAELEDAYFIDSAYSTEAAPRLSIAGVPRPPTQTRQLITSPLKDDFAVLKINPVPRGIRPLPLDLKMDPRKIPKLSPLITLGFPLGSRTQADTVNVSVTRGHVRRSFKHLFQVDASIYSGNSGGPVIDTRGKVIGIVSGVAMDYTQGPLPLAAPRWDLGMVLPITRAVKFLQALKSGGVKWNGVLDFSVDEALKQIAAKAVQGRWADAQALADTRLADSKQPQLFMAAAIMHFCAGDLPGARRLFSQALSIDEENNDARLMLLLIDWRAGRSGGSSQRKYLLAQDWRSVAEFQGYLARVLEGRLAPAEALKGWYTPAEKSWIYYVIGLIKVRRKKLAAAEKLLQQAVLAADPDSWPFFLARAELHAVQKQRQHSFKAETQWTAYNAYIQDFEQKVRRNLAAKKRTAEKLAPLQSKLAEEGLPLEQRLKTLEKIRHLFPQNRNVVLALAFSTAGGENWPKALQYVRTFLQTAGRQNSDRMSAGLLEAGILHQQRHEEKARAVLEAYSRQVRDPWYALICDVLLGKQTAGSLEKQAGENPQNLISAHTAMGFWAEGSGDRKAAIRHYRVALESFLDTWFEYGFVRERIRRLKRTDGGS